MNEDKKDIYSRQWITEKAKEILSTYSSGITIRQLHYRLVSIGMTNDINHYKRVVTAMTEARWNGIVDMEAFLDRERSVYGSTEADEKTLDDEIERGKEQVKAWMNAYHLNRWSNQDYYIEVWIEKKALQGVFETPCLLNAVGLAPCKGYPSITFLHDAEKRFSEMTARGKKIIILYFGDFDPSGEDIPRSIKENIERMGTPVQVIRKALNPEQISELGLPGVPPKVTDTRSRNWSGGEVVELDAVEPRTLEQMCKDAIKEYFDEGKYKELKEKESEERIEYRKKLKEYVDSLGADE